MLEVYPQFGTPSPNIEHPCPEPPPVPENANLIIGHFRGDAYLEWQDAARITILRHPIDRLISHYMAWRVIQPTIEAGEFRRHVYEGRIDIVSFAARLRRMLSQLYFSGVDMRNFDVIVCNEDYEAGIERMSAVLGVPLEMQRLNARGPYTNEKADLLAGRDGKLVAQIMEEDVDFYRAAVGR